MSKRWSLNKLNATKAKTKHFFFFFFKQTSTTRGKKYSTAKVKVNSNGLIRLILNLLSFSSVKKLRLIQRCAIWIKEYFCFLVSKWIKLLRFAVCFLQFARERGPGVLDELPFNHFPLLSVSSRFSLSPNRNEWQDQHFKRRGSDI